MALLIERAKLSGVYSDSPEFTLHLEREATALLKRPHHHDRLQANNRKWRVEQYEGRGLPHDHIPVAEV